MEGEAMYFPYVRGRQYELLALYELTDNDLLYKNVIPIVEPVKLSPTLVNVMANFIKNKNPLAIIHNPSVGTFMKEWQKPHEKSKAAVYKQQFIDQYEKQPIIKSLIIQSDAKQLLDYLDEKGVNKADLLVINKSRNFLDLYESVFGFIAPKYSLMPDENAFRRRVHHNKVLLDDKFKTQARNADYIKSPDEFFSDDHLHYEEDGFVGFSDYSVIGKEFKESGFAPRAVTIHIVYFAPDKTLRVKHFVSKSNEDINDTAGKYYEAVSKLADWYNKKPHPVDMTLGIKTFLQHHEQKSYHGLGIVKKLSLMHHLELMGKYLSTV